MQHAAMDRNNVIVYVFSRVPNWR